MKKVIFAILLTMMVLCGCSPKVVTPTEPTPVVPRVEYVYANSSNTVHVTDTVHIIERPDTFIQTEIKTIHIHNTDTLVVHDSITVIQPVPVEEVVYQKNPINEIFLWWSVICTAFFVLVILRARKK